MRRKAELDIKYACADGGTCLPKMRGQRGRAGLQINVMVQPNLVVGTEACKM